MAILSQLTMGSMCMMQVAHATDARDDMHEMQMSHVSDATANHHEAPEPADCSKGDCYIQANAVEMAAAQTSDVLPLPAVQSVSVLIGIDHKNLMYVSHSTAPPITQSFTQTLVLRC